MFSDFDATQTDIDNLNEIPDEEHKERENFDNGYFGAVAAAQELLNRNSVSTGAPSAAHHSDQVTGSNSVTAHTGRPNTKLPTIHLPSFSGRYQDWLEFHDTFKSLIHTNNFITNLHTYTNVIIYELSSEFLKKQL